MSRMMATHSSEEEPSIRCSSGMKAAILRRVLPSALIRREYDHPFTANPGADGPKRLLRCLGEDSGSAIYLDNMRTLRPHAARTRVSLPPVRREFPTGRKCNYMQYIAFDTHNPYVFASLEEAGGGEIGEQKIAHERRAVVTG